MPFTVGEVAKLAHISVRTLHHYDEIGLLQPSGRTRAGYRLYTDGDLARLQQLLFYRELGFALEEIRALLADPAFDRRAALLAQRALLVAQAGRLQAMLDLIDRTLDADAGGTPMSKAQMFEVFGDFDPAEHEAEARERWGDTPAYRESARRTQAYRKEDWQRLKAETDRLNAEVVALMDAGVAPDDARAMDAVEGHRQLIERWFYPCSRAMHAALGRMYVEDARFAAGYEKLRAGMAQYMQLATAANARRGA